MQDDRLRTFFTRYAQASQQSDPSALAALYAPMFLVGSPRGSQVFANDAQFLEWLTHVHTFNAQHGMEGLQVVSVRPVQLSARHVLATVTWGLRFAKTGDRTIQFDISYLLEGSGSEWKVLGYITERDQDEEMKALGILDDGADTT